MAVDEAVGSVVDGRRVCAFVVFMAVGLGIGGVRHTPLLAGFCWTAVFNVIVLCLKCSLDVLCPVSRLEVSH
jgi:hypothetical protein